MRNRSIYLTEPDAERLSLLQNYVQGPAAGRNLAALERKVAEAQWLDPSEIPPDVVTMNSRVRLVDPDTGEVSEYTVVFPARVDSGRNRISVLGPLGTALIGAKRGEVIEYTTFAGRQKRRVEAIIYQPEAVGEYFA